MTPTNPRCTIGKDIETKAVHLTSLDKCLRRYRANKKKIILVVTILEVEIGPKATALGRRRTFVVARFDLGVIDGNYPLVIIMASGVITITSFFG